ncbi:sensor histidine kinase [Nocardia sp. BMG51109]|uniref:sensor histidine kinase n=1 Tax=Nocardia sp. BMG51109 TaxID=1056816 RepID=UPI0004659004|nr:histidine kinase [Nocardia sp. BMG51109]
MRWNALPAGVQDGLVALFAFAIGAILYLAGLSTLVGPNTTPLLARFGVLALLCLATLLRRRAPLAALAAGVVPVGIDLVLGATVPVWLVYSDLIYAACLYDSRRVSRWVAGTCGAVSIAIAIAIFVITGEWRAAAVVIGAASVFAGTSVWWALQVRHHKEMAEAERTRAQAMAMVAEADRRAAIDDERRTMARDLHDVIAGHLSAIALQSEAALGVAGDRDPAVAGILGSIRTNSVDALQEMRTMIGLLRRDGGADGADGPVAPRGLAQLPLLVAAARDTGTTVRLRNSGEGATLPSAVDQAAYRIVQEALTNAMKHAPGREVDVEVAAGPDALALSVRNRLPATPSPDAGYARHGLINMRERAAALGGSFSAGTESADWVVTARLPLRERSEVA